MQHVSLLIFAWHALHQSLAAVSVGMKSSRPCSGCWDADSFLTHVCLEGLKKREQTASLYALKLVIQPLSQKEALMVFFYCCTPLCNHEKCKICASVHLNAWRSAAGCAVSLWATPHFHSVQRVTASLTKITLSQPVMQAHSWGSPRGGGGGGEMCWSLN